MRPFAIAVIVVVLAAACTGDEDGDVASSAPPATTTATSVATTIATSVATTVVPTTGQTPTPSSTAAEPTPTTTASSTPGTNEPSPSTSAPIDPSPTTDPGIEQIRQDVADALVASWEAFDEVVRDPLSREKNLVLQELMTESEYQDVVDEFLVTYITNDLAERTNEDTPAGVVPYLETLDYDAVAGLASMEYCFMSTNRLVLLRPDGSEALQDDQIAAVHELSRFELIDEAWIDSGGFTIEVFEGEAACLDR